MFDVAKQRELMAIVYVLYHGVGSGKRNQKLQAVFASGYTLTYMITSDIKTERELRFAGITSKQAHCVALHKAVSEGMFSVKTCNEGQWTIYHNIKMNEASLNMLRHFANHHPSKSKESVLFFSEERMREEAPTIPDARGCVSCNKEAHENSIHCIVCKDRVANERENLTKLIAGFEKRRGVSFSRTDISKDVDVPMLEGKSIVNAFVRAASVPAKSGEHKRVNMFAENKKKVG